MLYDPNATVTIGMPSAETPRAPSLNKLSSYAIVEGDPDALNKSWTTPAEVREVRGEHLDQLKLTPSLGQKGRAQTYAIFLPPEAEIPDWMEPGLNIYCKFDYSKQAVSGKLAQRAGMTRFAIENNLSTSWFLTETL